MYALASTNFPCSTVLPLKGFVAASWGIWSTYHNSHSSALEHATKQQERAHDFPPCTPSLHSAREYDNERDEGAELDDDVERGEEPDCSPHTAEVIVLHAVCLLGKGCAFAGYGGAAVVEAHGVLAFVILQGVSWEL
jgi:hypothetical protein